MDVISELRKDKAKTVNAWADAVFATYPLQTTGFLRTRSDPFANPVADMTREAGRIIFDAVIGEDVEPEKIKAALDRFIKFRAVQNVSPSLRLAPIYLFKPIMRKLWLPKMLACNQLDAYLECESRLDTLALLAFEMHAQAREIIAESRIREIKNQHAQLAKWANSLTGED